MEVKGSMIKQLNDLIKTKYKSIYHQWLESIPGESKSIFSNVILATNWYDIKYSLYEPTIKAAELLQIDPKDFFWETGDYAAENGLKGIYKIFIRVATPHFLLDRSRNIVVTFYKNTAVDVTKAEKNEGELKYSGFPPEYELLMYRIAGWINSSMRFTKTTNVVTKLENIDLTENSSFSVNIKWD
ncbi:MAG: hypothetical protein JXL97_01695 [Bacteroidales bacterium]|nr:hypothetical protein [Bacteroidales bacterium]